MAIIRTLIGNVKGAKGDTGATGATGAQGEAATITVGTTTTAAYGTNASVTNSGTETDAVFDFVIPQGAPGDEVTDASNLTLNEITASTATYPTFSVQEQLKTVFGKIQKFLSDIRTNGLFKSNLVNGFTQTTAGVNALDAAAGKSLNDALTNHFMVKSSGSMHDIHTSGVHYVTNAVSDKPHATGGLLTISFAANGNGAGIYQVASVSSTYTYAVNYVSSTDTWTYTDNMGGVTIAVDSVAASGGTKTITASQLYVIIGSSTSNHAIFQCRSGIVITHASAGSSITCTASGTTYTLSNGSTSAARYIALIVP